MTFERVHRSFVDLDNPRSVASRFRAGRWAHLLSSYPQLADMSVLDLGGRPGFWRSCPVQPKRVTTLNLEQSDYDAAYDVDWIEHRVGDVFTAPLTPMGWDLVFSNSLIEHVGGHANRQQLAERIRAAAAAHWVQTPYRYFPVEPHYVAPGAQFLPLRAKASFLRRWPVGHTRPETDAEAVLEAASIELLTRTHMKMYFPDAQIWTERVAGLPKSLVAIR